MRSDLYEDLYTKEHEHWWHVGKRAIVYGLLERYLQGRSDGRDLVSLDLGCGTGLNLQRLKKYGRVFGVDYAHEGLLFCRERGHDTLCLADAAELPFPDARFDLITALDVIEHLDDDQSALQELRRVLRPGGLMLVSVPAYPVLWTYWDDILGHRRRYTRASLRRVVNRAGLRVRKLTYSNFLILAPVIAVRIAKSLLYRTAQTRGVVRDPESDFMPLPRWLNNALITYYSLEARLLRRRNLPLGLSVVCIAERPHDPRNE